MTIEKGPFQIVVLQQVEASKWRVIQRQIHEGEISFVVKIADASEYDQACREARKAAVHMDIQLMVQGLHTPMRRFAAFDDVPADEERV